LTKQKPRIITPGLIASEPADTSDTARQANQWSLDQTQLSRCTSVSGTRRAAESNLRRLAGVSGAGACCRNPERSRGT